MKNNTIILSLMIMISLNLHSQNGSCDNESYRPDSPVRLCYDREWHLVFEDNFEGSNLDLEKWNAITGVPRDLSFKLSKQYFNPENVVVENNLLKIIIKDEYLINQEWREWVVDHWEYHYDDFDYTSGEIWTWDEFHYGKFEARIKIPSGKGFWPAFWLFGGHPYREIDIFEFNDNNFNKHRMNVFYDSDGDGDPEDCQLDYTGIDFSLESHVFTMIWTEEKIEWFVDNILVRTHLAYRTWYGNEPSGCMLEAGTKYRKALIFPEEPMNIILGTGTQTPPNAPDNSTLFPSQMEVEWVRFYSKTPLQYNKIIGPIIVCTSNSEFTFDNYEPYLNITWTKSNNLTEVGGNTGETYTVKANSSSTNGVGWVKAHVNGLEITKDIWIGKPDYTINGLETMMVRDIGIADIDYPASEGITNVDWTCNGSIASVDGGVVIGKFRAGNEPGVGEVFATATNLCGSNVESLYINVTGWLRIFPNPAINVLTIEIKKDKLSKEMQHQEIELFLYDKLMRLKDHKNYLDSSVTFDIASLKPDVYFLHIKIGNEVYKEKIVISNK